MNMGRKIVGNWKMNGDIALCCDMAIIMSKMKAEIESAACKVIICPPSPYLARLQTEFAHAGCGNSILLGAQDCSDRIDGSHTGEISVRMLKENGCSYVIIGHSERRRGGYDKNDQIAAKLERTLELSLVPILCIGEPIEVFEGGEAKVKHFLQHQLSDISSITTSLRDVTIIAYEPMWAIGTGKTPTPESLSSILGFIKSLLPKVDALYGGSVNVDNVKSIVTASNVNGVLVGTASLNCDKWQSIITQVIAN